MVDSRSITGTHPSAKVPDIIQMYGDELFHQLVKTIKKDDQWIIQATL